MLHEFLTNHRVELIARCRAKVAKRAHCATAQQLQNGVPMLLEQLVHTLRSEQERCGADGPVSNARSANPQPSTDKICWTWDLL